MTTCARVAFDAGERGLGMSIVGSLPNLFDTNPPVSIEEPFLPASPRYEWIDPGTRIHDWLYSSMAELWIKKHHFTSFFSGDKAIPVMEELRALGFLDEDMTAWIDFATTAIASGARDQWKGT